jgi:hypothetical protein
MGVVLPRDEGCKRERLDGEIHRFKMQAVPEGRDETLPEGGSLHVDQMCGGA